jgi:hypothetical protein
VIEITHRETGAILHTHEADTLEKANLAGVPLWYADLAGANLTDADLAGAILVGADLRGARLARADLSGVCLLGADLRGADLTEARMVVVSLDGVDATGAVLTGASLTGSYLAETRLVQATLIHTNLQNTYLGDADFSGARMAFTVLTDCPSLHQAWGLDTVEHLGPSALDLGTLRAGAAALPDPFLFGAGLTPTEIASLRQLFSGASYSSCLLAYAETDADFARRLSADLRAHDVSCWRYHPNIASGYRRQTAFNQAMKRHDHLVLLCSEPFLTQPDLPDQLCAVLERERETGTRKLLPVCLDDSLFSETLGRIATEEVAAGEWRADWVRALRERAVPTLLCAADDGLSPAGLSLLLNALRQPSGPLGFP